MGKLTAKLKIFLFIVFLITIGCLYAFLGTEYIPLEIQNFKKILFMGFLAVLTETFVITYRNISCSTTFSITIATYILYGPLATIIVMFIGFTFRVLKVNNNYKHIFNTPWYGTINNYCNLTLPILIANYFYLSLGGRFSAQNLSSNILQVVVFSIIYFVINTLLISMLFSIMKGKNVLYSFASNIRLFFLNVLAMIPFGLILALVFDNFDYMVVMLIIFPIILARYTFSLYIDSKSQYVQTVDTLMHAVEARDKYTEGHSQRVSQIVQDIAKEFKYNEWKLEQLKMASLLHDVGKVGIDDHILNKPGKLTDEEYNIIKSHPEIGYKILKDVKNLKDVIHIVKHHHERYDGKGYPDGTSGNEINLDVYIVQLADCVDAMSTDRPYRTALTPEKIISELEINSGTQFHPRVVEAYINLLKKQNKKSRGD